MTTLLIVIAVGLVWCAGLCWICCWNIERNEPVWYVLILSALWPVLGLGVLALWAWRRVRKAVHRAS